MTRPLPSAFRRALAHAVVLMLVAALMPAAMLAGSQQSSRYLVVFQGEYALGGTYALGAGYALAEQYALDGAYALDGGYALGGAYALRDGYALAEQYALKGHYALRDSYALTSDYALYALDGSYALASGYALYALYALDDVYALTGSDADYALTQGYALGGVYALGDNYALARDYALSLVAKAGGTVTADLTRQLGVMVVDSKNSAFAETMSSYALVASVGRDFGWKQFPTLNEALASGQLQVVSPSSSLPLLGSGAAEPLSGLQWDMAQIRVAEAHAHHTGSPNVRVGVVDTGIDGNHLDFVSNGRSNVDCASGADFTAEGPGIGIPAACVDNNFHGTHVAGTIAARVNGHGIVGVAPNVTLVPIKVCDADGHCYASDVVQGITHAGDLALDIINMSFYVDDDAFQQSTEFKCGSDPQQNAFRVAVQRALDYARGQGTTPIAALGNSNTDLANPPGGRDCKVIPAMSDGVVGVMSLGPDSGKARYSSYGQGWVDVAAPGGDGAVVRDTAAYCTRQIVSTIPGNLWACFQGTSMAAPHAAGVAALISSRYGAPSRSGVWYMDPKKVASRLEATAIDIGLKGYDMCFGNGRVDALRAVTNDSKKSYDSSAPLCAEYR
ncbi:MAG TPA: S8 family serine peptidase [Candidatus Limnocylindrales bacterium]|nr:S8 family serine peptidase [Candidatus Limnocylindrales bacterium]